VALSDALRSFAARLAELDPPLGSAAAVIQVDNEPIELTRSAVAALTKFLEGYRDPRANGDCDNCGGRRIDANFICLDCGHASGVFGQLLRERSARFQQSPSVGADEAPSGPTGSASTQS
jgi:hypothetical protein